MRKIFFVLLMAFSCSAWAAWENISKAGSYTYYVDTATIKKEGTIHRAWVMKNRDFKLEGEMSVRYLQEFDCKREQSRYLQISQFSGVMGSGDEVDRHDYLDDAWDYIAPGTVDEHLLDYVCAR